jgi:hypothetical protein
MLPELKNALLARMKKHPLFRGPQAALNIATFLAPS